MLGGVENFEKVEEYTTRIKNISATNRLVRVLFSDGNEKAYRDAVLMVKQGVIEYYVEGYIVFSKPTKVKIVVYRDPFVRTMLYVRVYVLEGDQDE